MIISGFGMCNGYYQKLKTGTYSIDAFYSKRYKRTVPFFALLILLNCVTEFTPKTVCEGLMEITMLFGFLPNNTLSTIGVAWTLGAIFAFYIIFPFIVFLLYQLVERRRQGLGKPNLLYVKDLYAGLSQSNYWKYENQTSGGLKSELPGVWKSNGSKTDINNTDSSETDLIYSAPYVENTAKEMREDERYRLYFQDKLEIPILEKNFPHDREILMEILELLVETVTSRKKFLRICGEEKPKEVVKSRLMKLDSMHIQYVMECLKSNTTQVRNIKQYLLATLYNAPTTIDSYYAAQVRHDFGWGGRSN